jgi:hypothetical protein
MSFFKIQWVKVYRGVAVCIVNNVTNQPFVYYFIELIYNNLNVQRID